MYRTRYPFAVLGGAYLFDEGPAILLAVLLSTWRRCVVVVAAERTGEIIRSRRKEMSDTKQMIEDVEEA